MIDYFHNSLSVFLRGYLVYGEMTVPLGSSKLIMQMSNNFYNKN